jgi:uncharacterized beta-barrel protein YwiB (DUF1934 family)
MDKQNIKTIDMKQFKEEYKKEKGFECWTEGSNYGSYTDDYVNWLEKKLALTIPVVNQRGELFCKCTTDTDIYQNDGYIKCQTCYKPIKLQNCG